MRNQHFMLSAALIVGFCGGLVPAPGHANLTYAVSLYTSPLTGHPAAPFYLDFQFIDGDGTGDGNNIITLSNFDFEGGNAVGSPVTNGGISGGASGDLTSGVTITDSSFFNEFYQEFTPGISLSFTLTSTTNVESPTPDQFSFAILDSSLSELPTQSTFGAFVEINLDSPTPVALIYASDPATPPLGGGDAIVMNAPNVKSVDTPGTLALLAVGLLGFLRTQLSKSPNQPHAGASARMG